MSNILLNCDGTKPLLDCTGKKVLLAQAACNKIPWWGTTLGAATVVLSEKSENDICLDSTIQLFFDSYFGFRPLCYLAWSSPPNYPDDLVLYFNPTNIPYYIPYCPDGQNGPFLPRTFYAVYHQAGACQIYGKVQGISPCSDSFPTGFQFKGEKRFCSQETDLVTVSVAAP